MSFRQVNTMGLLKGIDPLLTADLLHVLRSMGHGDKLRICDVTFPAASIATHTTSGKHVILAGDHCPTPFQPFVPSCHWTILPSATKPHSRVHSQEY